LFTEILKAIIYGMIEGVCEWLPISSTGHLILLEEFLTLQCAEGAGEAFRENFMSMFDFVIQLGAICAVAVIYFDRLNIFSRKKTTSERRQTASLYFKLVLASIPAAAVGVLGDRLCEALLGGDIDSLFYNSATVAAMLMLYGILFIVAEKLPSGSGREDSKEISTFQALAIGCFQALAVIPGTSRSGATMLGARLMGIDRKQAAEFSFFLGIPTICGAGVLKSLDFFAFVSKTDAAVPPLAIAVLLVATLTSFLVSLFVIKGLIGFVKNHGFTCFGIYRIILGAGILLRNIIL